MRLCAGCIRRGRLIEDFVDILHFEEVIAGSERP